MHTTKSQAHFFPLRKESRLKTDIPDQKSSGITDGTGLTVIKITAQ
jgi:hypothetical protein